MNGCECLGLHERRRLVLTGGPGAGKTAVLEMVRRSMCRHVHVLPEAAGVVFGGGFPRDDDSCRRAAQRAIYHVQRELEVAGDAHNPAIVLCDRGTVDGLAYWPAPAQDFWSATGTTLSEEMARYDVVVHLRTPSAALGYNQLNPLRTETPSIAREVDDRILAAWEQHPRRYLVDPAGEFLDNAARVLEILRAEMPSCCGPHLRPSSDDHGTAARD